LPKSTNKVGTLVGRPRAQQICEQWHKDTL